MSPTAQLPRWLKPANRIVKLLHRAGVPLGTIHVITIPGRTSGEPRSTPVSPLTIDGRRYVIAGLANSSWAKNARAAGHGQLSKGRAHEDVDLIEVTDPELRRKVMVAFPSEVPHGVQFFVRIGLVRSADPAEFAAASDEVNVFEICAPHRWVSGDCRS
jgi:F420H(2)-dependent quinone reductase